jgi:pyruvate/2-oxoglutarate dehydrogenase complex dihydrolipoamide dehydrogenase (E3) component/anti-anti-sigma regulatory factor
MAKAHDYDVIVIGAGIAGFVSAVTANGLGKRVAIIEKRKVGGNCTNFTCIPSKALIRSSHVSREMAHLDRLGLQTASTAGLDTGQVMAQIRSVIQKAYEKDLPETFEKIGIHVLPGAASFVDQHQIQVDGQTLSAEKFIVAVGTRPLIPPITGLRDVDYLTNENLYQLDSLPRSLIILGGGVDGLEYASAFGRLGVETTVVEMSTRLLPMADRELVNRLLQALQADGIRMLPGAKAAKLWKEHDKVVLMFEGGEGYYGEVQADRVLVSIGRKPDLEGLLLEKAGVKYSPRGIITDTKLRTSAPNIYACGDIVGPYQLASTAEYQGMLAATNAVLPIKRKVDYRNNVYVIFTEPPLAYLGLTEEEAHKKHGASLKVYRFDYSTMRRAMVDGTEVGIGKFLCDGSGRLVGAHILGEAAPDVIHEAQVIKALNQPLHKLHSVTHAYPTYAQALVGRASQLAYLDRMGSNFFVRKALELLPGCANRLNLARERLAETQPTSHDVKRAGPDLIIQTETYGDVKACVIDLPTDLMDHDESPIVAALSAGGSKDPHDIILNFADVRQINGLGASMLVKLSACASRKGQRLKGFGVAQGLRDVLHVTGLDQVIQTYESKTEALSAAGVAVGQASLESRLESSVAVDTRYWAKPVMQLKATHRPKEARSLNVDGHSAVSPVNGFGQLWQKTYRLHVAEPAIAPEQAIAALKQNFPALQPWYNRFFPSLAGIQPGEIVLFDSLTPAGPVSTGVVVLYADERSFTFITPQGHPECGMVSFSAYEAGGGIVAEILGLARASDPIYEAGLRIIGSKVQVRIWTHVLTSLAAYLGVPAHITAESTCVDSQTRWSQIGNIWRNAQIRTLVHEPVWWLTAPLRSRSGKRADSA